MDFTDKNLKLTIGASDKDQVSFKAYLEESDIAHIAKDQALSQVPLSYRNDNMMLRIDEKAKFTFNVFSEDRLECIDNYLNLQKILSLIKPVYYLSQGQLVPTKINTTGLLRIDFKGLPVKDRESIRLHLTSFNYQINKELGYIQVPKKELINRDKVSSRSLDEGELKLIPLSYKLSIDGLVLLEFEKVTRGSNSYSSKSKSTRYDPKIVKVIDDWMEKNDDPATSGKFADLSPAEKDTIYSKFKEGKKWGYVDDNGIVIKEADEKFMAGLFGFTAGLSEMLAQPPFRR